MKPNDVIYVHPKAYEQVCKALGYKPDNVVMNRWLPDETKAYIVTTPVEGAKSLGFAELYRRFKL